MADSPAVLTDWTVALLSQRDFDALPDYSCSLPTGTTIGKRWKRREPYEDGPPGTVHTWWMGEYVPDEREGYIGIRWSKIKLMTPRQAQVAEALGKERDGPESPTDRRKAPGAL